MDIQAYIQSGIIESYVLGLASAEEVAELDSLRLQHLEVGQAIDDFSLLLEEQAIRNAVAPPAHVKAAILAEIKEESQTLVIPIADSSESAPVVHVTYFRKWRIVAAASIILLIASAALNFYLYDKYTRTNEDYQSLVAERNTLLVSNQAYYRQLSDSNVVIVMMKDPTGKTGNVATVSWNTKSKEVLLMANKLPKPAPGKQYQLWAIVGDQKIDAGMLNQECNSACKMKNMSQAQAFAITLEDAGGKPQPTMQALYVLGKV